MPRVVWAEDSKTGVRFKILAPQQKCYCKPNLQLTANPAVGQVLLRDRISTYVHTPLLYSLIWSLPLNPLNPEKKIYLKLHMAPTSVGLPVTGMVHSACTSER